MSPAVLSAAAGLAHLALQEALILTELERFTTPGGREAWLHVRPGTNDHNTLWSCLNEDEYRLPAVSGVAWDIGAYTGPVTVGLLLDNPDLHVIAVEPVPENCDLFWRNVRQNGVQDRVTLITGAVGKGPVQVNYAFEGSELARHHAFVGNLTLLPPDKGTQRVVYQGKTIRDLVFTPEVPYVPELVKIDTEGGEWSFLDDPLAGDLPLIVGEWHPIGGTIGDFIALLPDHEISFTGPQAGPGGFRAVRK